MSTKKKKNGDKEVRRFTLYMREKLFSQVVAQANEEGTTNSRLVVELLNLLLMSPLGKKLHKSAKENRLSLSQELENNLVLFNEQLTTEETEEISRLAEASKRNPNQMLIYLVLLGLQVYRIRSGIEQEQGLEL